MWIAGTDMRWLNALIAAALWFNLAGSARANDKDEAGTIFFAIADPQINIPRWGTAGTERTIDIMNDLPGKPFPFGGTVGEPVGVISAGDLVDDMSNRANWELYKKFFDPRGDARPRFPVFEGIGNHDLLSEQAFGDFNWLQEEFVERSQQRPGEFHFCENGYHYAWQ